MVLVVIFSWKEQDLKKNNLRVQAADIIYQVRFSGAYLNKSLQQVSDLSPQDQGLLTNIAYGTIKHYDYLRTLLRQQMPTLKVKKRVEVILILSLYQFLYLERIPTYAIVDNAVEMSKKHGGQPIARFVNATLHRLFADKTTLQLDTTDMDTAAIFAVTYSMPLWLIKLLLAQYGATDTKFYLDAMMLPARQFIRYNRLKVSADYSIEHAETRDLPFSGEYLGGSAVKHPDFLQGKFTIQNLSSQRVGYFVEPQPEESILDMCAAPGGKTTHLAELTADKAHILALDLYPQRVTQIEENATRLGINNIKTLVADATTFVPETDFDKVLLDAPCSGLGVLAQKPEIRYTITPEALDELVALQATLLEKAWSVLKPGGTLIYSTCTINRKENEKQVENFLKKVPNGTLVEEQFIFSEMAAGSAGFYLAKLVKA